MKLLQIYEDIQQDRFLKMFNDDPKLIDELMNDLKELKKRELIRFEKFAKSGKKYNNTPQEDVFYEKYSSIHSYVKFLEKVVKNQSVAMNRDEYQKYIDDFSKGLSTGTYRRGKKIRDVVNVGGVYEAEGNSMLFRGVTLDDYTRIEKQGYIDTDCRNCIDPDEEGINLADNPSTAITYIPSAHGGVVLVINPRGLNLFKIGADDYIRASGRIPKGNIIKVSSPLYKGKMSGTFIYQPDKLLRLHVLYLKFKNVDGYSTFTKTIENFIGNHHGN